MGEQEGGAAERQAAGEAWEGMQSQQQCSTALRSGGATRAGTAAAAAAGWQATSAASRQQQPHRSSGVSTHRAAHRQGHVMQIACLMPAQHVPSGEGALRDGKGWRRGSGRRWEEGRAVRDGEECQLSMSRAGKGSCGGGAGGRMGMGSPRRREQELRALLGEARAGGCSRCPWALARPGASSTTGERFPHSG